MSALRRRRSNGDAGATSRGGRALAPAGEVEDGPYRPPAIPAGELDRRRVEAAERFAQAHWDLGGLAYEMAVRDHFRLDVLRRQAGRVQELDAELSQLESLGRLAEAGAAGTCSNCRAPYPRGSAFCARCGEGLVDTVTTS